MIPYNRNKKTIIDNPIIIKITKNEESSSILLENPL